jgi:hypothetical protein
MSTLASESADTIAFVPAPAPSMRKLHHKWPHTVARNALSTDRLPKGTNLGNGQSSSDAFEVRTRAGLAGDKKIDGSKP